MKRYGPLHEKTRNMCNEQSSQATSNPVGGKACSSTKGNITALYTKHSIHKFSSLKFAYFQWRLSRHITSPSEKTRPESLPGTTWVRQPRSVSCHYPTAATKCNEKPSQATGNPVGGKACSSTKGGLLCYIPNTYSVHKFSSLKFAYLQGRLSRHICICENKGSDQLRCENKRSDRLHGNREADQRLCLRYTNSKIPLLSKSEISSFLAIFCRCTDRFESDLVGNPDC